ncbi:tRNA lysidine(34) synthetase TilS, partial [Dissulfurirhabdus thermomarina]
LPGAWAVPGTPHRVRAEPAVPPEDFPRAAPLPGGRTLFVDAARLPDALALRTRRPGDRFWPLGAPAPVRLKGFLSRRGVPRSTRDTLPLLVDEGEVLAVLGVEVSHRVRVRPDTRRAFSLTLEPR